MNLAEYLKAHPIKLNADQTKSLKKLYRERDFYTFNSVILGGARAKGHVTYHAICNLLEGRLTALWHSHNAETTYKDFTDNTKSAIKSLECDELLTSGARHYFLEQGPAVFERAENFLKEFRSAHKYCTELMEAFNRENTVCVNIRMADNYKRDGEWLGARQYYLNDQVVTDEIIKTLSKKRQTEICGSRTASRAR